MSDKIKSAQIFRPSIDFLSKVRDGHVRRTFSYSQRSGGQDKFYGGEKTAAAHARAGFIEMRGWASMGNPDIAKLTPAGLAALSASEKE